MKNTTHIISRKNSESFDFIIKLYPHYSWIMNVIHPEIVSKELEASLHERIIDLSQLPNKTPLEINAAALHMKSSLLALRAKNASLHKPKTKPNDSMVINHERVNFIGAILEAVEEYCTKEKEDENEVLTELSLAIYFSIEPVKGEASHV